MDDGVRIRITDMVLYAGKAVRILGEHSAETLALDDVHLMAVTHAVQIVGEAARKVPDDIRQRVPSVAWQQSVAMWNILVHAYGDVDVGILVDTVRRDFQPLIADLERLLGEDDT
jgi:Uncharacterized conserved protein